MSKNIGANHVEILLESGVKLDIHLHLAKEKIDFWQNNPRRLETGAIKRIISFLFHYFFGETRPKIVEEEWENQIQAFQKLFGKNPDGISSHEHIHFFPAYFRVIVRLSLKFNIPYIRFGKNSSKEKNNICLILNTLRRINYRCFKKSKLNSSDLMVSFDWIKDFSNFLKNIPTDKKVEIIFHPEINREFEILKKL